MRPPAPWLSLLFPVHDVAPYLDACVESVIHQADEGVELLFVDDGSTTGEAALLARWQARHPDRIRVLTHDACRGVSAARNVLLRHAHGTHVWFVDPDDLVAPGALRGLRATLEAHDPDLVLCDFSLLRELPPRRPGEPAWRTRRRNRPRARDRQVRTFVHPPHVLRRDADALLAGLFERGHWHLWTKIVRREAWPAGLAFPEGRVFEDLAVVPRLVLALRSYVYVPEPWIAYRQRPGSIVNTRSAQRLQHRMVALEGFADHLRQQRTAWRPTTLWAVARFSAATWHDCLRQHREGAGVGGAQVDPLEWRRLWQSASPLDAPALARGLLLRGQWRRAWHLRECLRSAPRQALAAPPMATLAATTPPAPRP